MNNTYKYSAINLLEKIIEFTSMTPNPEDWSFKLQKFNDPRFIRLQQIMSLFWAFIPGLNSKEIRDDLENFYSGDFILTRKTNDYHKLIDLMDNTISKSDFGIEPKREIYSDHLQFNYRELLNYYIGMNKLAHNCGIMEISYPYFFSYIVTKSISDSMRLKVEELGAILSLFIDPFQRSFTMEELIKDFYYPEEDLFEIDLNWK